MAKQKTQKKLIRSLEATGFYSDFDKPNCLYAALIRSPTQTGKLKSISIPELPEGYFYYTAKDIPGEKNMKFDDSVTKIFGYDNIVYEGEPLGIIFGPDEQKVYELLDEVNINFDVENLESALTNVMNKTQDTSENISDLVEQLNDMPSLDDVIDKNRVVEEVNKVIATREIKYGLYEKLTEEQADKEIFENADIVTSDTWKQTLYSPKWTETDGAFCYTEGDKIHVYVPTKWTYLTQKTISQALNIEPELIFIHKTLTPTVYPNGLWRTTQIATQAAIASYLSKKPIKLVLSQKEQDKFMRPGVDTTFDYKVALKEDGTITGLKININIDVGSSNPFAQEITDRITLGAVNYYKPQNLYIHTTTQTSQKPPTTLSIRVIDSQSFFAIENQIQKICYDTSIFPDELRLQNAKQTKVQEKKNPFPFEIEDWNIEEVLQSTMKKSDFNRKYASFHMEAVDRLDESSNPFFALPLRGIGIATGYKASGFVGSQEFYSDSKIEVTLTTDSKLVIHAIKPADVIQDIWKTTASEILQLPKEDISINSEYTCDDLPKTPEQNISSIGIMTEVIKKCCTDIQKKRFHQPLPITSKKSIFPSSSKKWNNDTFVGKPFSSSAFIATAVEVELDTYTYNEKIKGIWVTVDCGELYEEKAAIKTLKKEIQQELTTLVHGKTVSCDAMNIYFVQSNNKSGQVSGLIHNTLPAAFSSALSLALTTQLTEIPCTESQLFTLMKNRTKTRKDENEIINDSEMPLSENEIIEGNAE